jgi:hypothetical protein
MSGRIEVGAIVSIGKAKTLWEVARVYDQGKATETVQLVKVDGDGYVNLTKKSDEVVLRANPCQDVSLAELIRAKEAARRAAFELADRLRLWPAEDEAWAEFRKARTALEAWTDARDRHYTGRRLGNIEAAIKARREERAA